MIYVLYHKNCMDGFAAAYAAWLNFKDKATYIPVNYGEPVPYMPNAESVYILDFSYPRNTLVSLYENLGGELLVLDHHKTAEKELIGLPFARFDQTKSGAVMAWERFQSEYRPMPEIIAYIQDRDLWQWKLPESQAVNAALRLQITDYTDFETFHQYVLYTCTMEAIEQIKTEGAIIVKYEQQIVERLLKQEYRQILSDRTPIWSVNSPILQSEIGHALASEHGLGDVYYEIEGKRRHSLRSVGEIDVSEIAKAYGGGGHKNAAGFEETL